MAKSLSSLMIQIEKLQKEAANIQAGIVDRIKKEIAKHGLSVEHLFGSSTPVSASKSTSPAKPIKPAKQAKAKSTAKFADANGNAWSGFGPKPAWLRTALDSGRSIDEFMNSASPLAKPKTSKVAGTPKFADGAGNTWGGMGKRPDWIRAALGAGQSLDDFLVAKRKPAAPAKKSKAVKVVKPAAPAAKAKPVSAKKPAAKKAAPASKKVVKPRVKTAAVAAKKAPKAVKAARVAKAPVADNAQTVV